MDFALHIHTYIHKNPSLFVFFPSDGRKLSVKTTVEKNPKKSIISHFLATHTYINPSLMDFLKKCFVHLSLSFFSVFCAPFPLR